MTEGEKIQLLREHDRTLEAVGERLRAVEDELKKHKELLKSPISRAAYAAKHGGN